LLFFASLVVCGCSTVIDGKDDGVGEYVKVGDRVPQFSVEAVCADGSTTTFSTGRLTGETVIVFFNTTCPDCQRDLPLLNQYYIDHQGKEGFQMVAISREEGEESVGAYWQTNSLSIPYSAQTDRTIYNLFASSIIPRIYFCNKDGIVTRIDVENFLQ
jgi:peroxiredoxin